MSLTKKDLITEEGRAFWEGVEKDAREVRTWPAWKQVGVSIELPEHRPFRPYEGDSEPLLGDED